MSVEHIGKKYGRLTVTRLYVEKRKTRAEATCDCGKKWNGVLGPLVRGKTKSCGCGVGESARARFTTHGATAGSKQGSDVPKEYRTYIAMRRRCTDEKSKDYPFYGGKGVKVCDRWSTYEKFLADMGPAPDENSTLERLDSDGEYGPSNCVWADRKAQANNTNRNRMIDMNGKTQSMALWCDELGLNYYGVRTRIQKGWDPVRALTTPLLRVKRKGILNG